MQKTTELCGSSFKKSVFSRLRSANSSKTAQLRNLARAVVPCLEQSMGVENADKRHINPIDSSVKTLKVRLNRRHEYIMSREMANLYCVRLQIP